MELERFLEIRKVMCAENPLVTEGKMMRSPAIKYNGSVFAFLSRQHKMVFKLGKDYPDEVLGVPRSPFNPFKTKKPLAGWYELGFGHQEKWGAFAAKALEKIKSE
ncbi:hypothetical protein GTQ34_06780 [Muricauda sp. JGD-17]|uniref:YjbR protein n=1 Tax=Flagellimonas ochracea TaxID=2696472 RepID=A0A964WX01_9FLAO|nr:hypothetical protein [Allomuricauda ochracea]NAY91616.1 hypothetical protein [Allomuricauda ochracea]